MKNNKQATKPTMHNRASIKNITLSRLGGWSRVLLLLLSDYRTKEASYRLIQRIRSTWKHNGPDFLVVYLKEAHRLVTKVLAGTPEIANSGCRVATRRGVPLIIPIELRSLIETGDIVGIRITLSILSLYRLIKATPKENLSTITKPFTGLGSTLSLQEIALALSPLDYKTIRLRPNGKLLQLTTAGPNFHTSGVSGGIDAYAFYTHYPALMGALEKVCRITAPAVWKLFQSDVEYYEDGWHESYLHLNTKESNEIRKKLDDAKLGRLSRKFEAAGKVRIFAITDLWTQSALKPLHDYLFAILKLIPQDGTFDQLKPLNALYEKGCTTFYSYDLTAATDRLPIDLQVQVLQTLKGPELAIAWKELLVDRPWWLDGVPYRYAVGQPMGALSSWGSLALTHHIIIQIAARRVGWSKWFDLYAVLGDDVVIADSSVAKAYVALMAYLGLDINQSKSLESTIGIAEFAKRIVSPRGDYSPVSPKLMLMTLIRPRHLVAAVRDMFSRGTHIQALDLERWVEKISKNKRLPQNFIWEMTGPLGFLNLLGLAPFLGHKSLTETQLQLVAHATDLVVNRHLVKLHFDSLVQDTESLSTLTASITSRLPSRHYWRQYSNLPSRSGPIGHIEDWHKFPEFPKTTDGSPMLWDFLGSFPSTRVAHESLTLKVQKAKAHKPTMRDHRFLLAPIGYNNQSVYNYLVESFSALEKVTPSIPSLTSKPTSSLTFSSRVKLYKELEEALEQYNISMVLDIRKLPNGVEEGVVTL